MGDKVLIFKRYRAYTIHLSMRLSVASMPAFADDAPRMDQHRAHHGVGRNAARAEAGQLEAAAEEAFVQ